MGLPDVVGPLIQTASQNCASFDSNVLVWFCMHDLNTDTILSSGCSSYSICIQAVFLQAMTTMSSWWTWQLPAAVDNSSAHIMRLTLRDVVWNEQDVHVLCLFCKHNQHCDVAFQWKTTFVVNDDSVVCANMTEQLLISVATWLFGGHIDVAQFADKEANWFKQLLIGCKFPLSNVNFAYALVFGFAFLLNPCDFPHTAASWNAICCENQFAACEKTRPASIFAADNHKGNDRFSHSMSFVSSSLPHHNISASKHGNNLHCGPEGLDIAWQ